MYVCMCMYIHVTYAVAVIRMYIHYVCYIRKCVCICFCVHTHTVTCIVLLEQSIGASNTQLVILHSIYNELLCGCAI